MDGASLNDEIQKIGDTEQLPHHRTIANQQQFLHLNKKYVTCSQDQVKQTQ